MEKVRTYEQYSRTLAAFKEGRARCGTNMLMMRDELTELIGAGKLYYEQIGETLWFFSDEEYYYKAHLYVPADAPVRMQKQDRNVLAELMGNERRYDAFWQRRGYVYRTAAAADYPRIRALWLDMLGRDSYNVSALTGAELEEMERYGRCSLICDGQGEIRAAAYYLRPRGAKYAYVYNVAGAYKGSGLGAAAYFDALVHIYAEGCARLTSWVRQDNEESLRMTRRAEKPSGKFFWQFVLEA